MGRTRRSRAIGAIAIVGVAAVVAGALVFQPWRLVIDTEVRDADPFAAAAAAPTTVATAPATTVATAPATTAPPPTGATSADLAPPTTVPPVPSTTVPTTSAVPAVPAVRVGSFRSIAHQTSGNVRVGATADGRQVVFLEDLATDNGPDVRVLLSPHPADGDASILASDALELGLMKGNVGDQTYEVPADVDLSQFQSVVLWCERFSVGFGVAGLTAE